MKRFAKAVASVFLLTLTTACSEGNEEDSPTSEFDPGPGAFDPDFASSSDFFTQMSEPAEGLDSSPHGVVQIYYSTNIEEAITLEEFVAPVGTVALKTQKYDDGDYGEILVMIKQEPGSLPETDDWLYEVRLANGDVEMSGPSLSWCNDCHAAYEATDGLPGVGISN